MGGKVKASDVAQSKTAKKSAGKEKAKGFQASGDVSRIISLANGTWAYVLHPISGKTCHIKVYSDQWNDLLRELMETAHASKIQNELEALGWKMTSPTLST